MSLSRRLQPLALAFAMVAMPMADAAAQQVYDVADVVDSIMPSVAHIEAQTAPSSGTEEDSSTGSGFVYDAARGYIITNNHVVGEATAIAVIIDGYEYDGTLVGTDAATDVAVVQITPDPAQPLVAVRMGNSDGLRVGNAVIAVGAPFGFTQTVTTGIISAKDRAIGTGPYDQHLQTDAAINPGNSGGPLFNVRGELIGVNTAIFSPTGANAGIGFSIPSNHMAWVAEQLIAHGRVNWGYIGAGLRPLTDEERTAVNLSPRHEGVAVGTIAGNGPAAGVLQTGDIILSVNGETINNPRQLRLMIGKLLAGANAELSLQRHGAPMTVTLTLGARPLKSDTPAEQQPSPEQDKDPAAPEGEMPTLPEPAPEEDDTAHNRQLTTPPVQRLQRAQKGLAMPAP